MRQGIRTIQQIRIRRRRAMSSIATISAFQWRQGTEDAVAQSVSAFNAFLRQAKTDVHSVVANIRTSSNDTTAAPKVVHVVIGNEAADADSIVSSLVYAHFKQHSKALNAHEHADVYVPVLPIPREELVLRCDVSSLFSKLQLDLDALLFVDEFPWQHAAFGGAGSKSATLRLTLLDHNALNTKRMVSAQLQSKSEIGQVVEILDHHMDLGKHPTAPVREIAFADGQALVASNCTLVAEKIVDFSNVHGRNDDVFALSSTLLLAVIGLDSVNFDPKAKKVTARDIQVANELEKTSFATKEALFTWLQAEKFNPAHWDAFTVRNCLQCDYKEFQLPSDGGVYGVSAILIDLQRFVKKADASAALIEQLQAFAQENNLAFLLVMTMYVDADGTRRRQLLFYEPSSSGDKETKSLVPKCVQFLEQEGSLQLERLELPATHAHEWLTAFSQRNAGASRKQVVPLLQQALEAPKTESKY